MSTPNQVSSRDLEQLSAYLDGQLEPGEVSRLEARLRLEPRLRSELEELRSTVRALSGLPKVRSPRNFTLRQAPVRRAGGYPLLRLGTTLAALAFLVVVGLDVLLARAGSAGLLASRQLALPAEPLAEAQTPAVEAAPALAAATQSPAATEAIQEEFAAAEAESAAPAPTATAQTAPAATGTSQPESLGYRADVQATQPPTSEPAAAEDRAAAQPATGGEEQAANADQVGELAPLDGEVTLVEHDRSPQGTLGSRPLLRAAEVGLGVLALVLGGLTVRARRAD